MIEAKGSPYLLGFAGHRQVEDRQALARVLRGELEWMKSHLGEGLIGISSAAAGSDLVFLKTCVEMRIPTIVILPFDEARFSEDFDDREEWSLAEKLMGVALDRHVIGGGHEAPAAYQVVSDKLVEWADAFLFVWNGEPPRGPGGTAETVNDAKSLGIPSRVVASDSLESRWEVPVQTGRAPRHGFSKRSDLLDFLEERFC